MAGKRSSGGSPGVFSKRGVSSSGSSTSHTKSPSSPSQPSATASTTKTTTPATTQQTKTQQNNTTPPHQQPGAQVPPTGGRSMLGDIATTAMGSMAGVMGAHAIMNAFGGNKEGERALENNAGAANQMAAKCSVQLQGFFKCLENNNSNISNCQWSYDLVRQCQNQALEEM